MNEVNNSKQRNMFIFGLVALLLLVLGASYAYFAVNTVNNFGTSIINAQAGNIGTVTLNGSSANLSMSLSAVDMVKGNSNVTYYASASGKTTEETVVTLGTATVNPTSDTNYYHCSYILNVTHTGTRDMYTIFNSKTNNTYNYADRSTNQIILTINDTDYDFYNGWPENNRYSGDFYIKGNQTRYITASFKFINVSNKNQNYLAGSDINISLSLNSFSCTAEEEPSWVYYGWGTTNSDYNVARNGNNIFLRSGTTAKSSGVTSSDIVQVCGLIDGTMRCIDYFDSSRGDGTSFSGASADCIIDNDFAFCFDNSTGLVCRVNSSGGAYCDGFEPM